MFELSFLKSLYSKYLFPLLAISLMALILATILIFVIVDANIDRTRDDLQGVDSKQIIADQKFKQHLYVVNASEKIDIRVNSIISDIRNLAAHPYIVDFKIRKIPEVLAGFDSKIHLKEFRLINENGQTLYSSYKSDFSDVLVNKSFEFSRLNKDFAFKELYFSDPKIDTTSFGRYINVYVAIKDKRGILSGGMILSYNLEFLAEYIEIINPDEWGEVYVLNENNKLLVGAGIQEGTKDVFKQLKPQYQTYIQKDSKGQYLEEDLFTFQVNSLGWKTVIKTPQKLYRRQVNERTSLLENEFGDSKRGIVLFTIFVILGIIGLCILIGTKVAKGVTRPILNLIDATKKVEEGDLDVVIEVESKDEIGQLASSFNSMTDAVADFQGKLMAEKGNVEDKTKKLEDQKIELRKKNTALEESAIRLEKTNKELSVQKSQLETHQVTLETQKTQLETQKQLLEDQKRALETQKKELEEQKKELSQSQRTLEVQAEKLLESNASLEQYARTVSHDLKEPLRMVSSYVHLLNENYVGKPLDEEGKQYMGFIADGSKRMSIIIDDLLTFARFDTNVERHNFEAVDLEDAFIAAKFNLKILMEESNATIITQPLPTVNGKFSFMMQVFQNLLSNAMRYRKNEEALTININVISKEDFWEFEVKDNGEGIEERNLEKIFLAFKRFNNRYRSDGSGIGLAIVRKIVRHHGGEIWAKSEKGVGTSIFFTLPKINEVIS